MMEISKIRGENRFSFHYDCVAGCGAKLHRVRQADSKKDAMNLALGFDRESMTCYTCSEKAKPVEQKVEERIAQIHAYEIKRKREYLGAELEKAIRAAQEELSLMKSHEEYFPFTNGRTNWVEHYSEKAQQYADEVTAHVLAISELRRFFPDKLAEAVHEAGSK